MLRIPSPKACIFYASALGTILFIIAKSDYKKRPRACFSAPERPFQLNFQYYKIEYGAGEHPSNWNVIGDLRRNQVSEGVLQSFNAAAFPPGVYFLRLTVVDLTGNFPIAPCAVRVFLGE